MSGLKPTPHETMSKDHALLVAVDEAAEVAVALLYAGGGRLPPAGVLGSQVDMHWRAIWQSPSA